jgi:hypothetical protein
MVCFLELSFEFLELLQSLGLSIGSTNQFINQFDLIEFSYACVSIKYPGFLFQKLRCSSCLWEMR